jgi:hypothetical protein
MEAAPMTQVHHPNAATSGWEGNAAFGGMMLVLAGGFHVLAGFVAIFNDAYWQVPSQDLVVSVDYTAWGWLHLALGVVALVTGFGVLRGQAWARMVGIGLAALSAVVNLAFMAAFPVWAFLVIGLDILVIHSLLVRSDEHSLTR